MRTNSPEEPVPPAPHLNGNLKDASKFEITVTYDSVVLTRDLARRVDEIGNGRVFHIRANKRFGVLLDFCDLA